jgi:LPXTG-site transpeptidase (sortase) family protein
LGGNTGMAGHVTLRTGERGPFYTLAALAVGEEILIYTEQNVYTYKVREQILVEETDLSVVAPTENSQLTLVTCDEWNAQMRLYLKRRILFADLVEVRPLGTSGY